MNQVKILYFATLKDAAGVSQHTFSLPEGADVAMLKEKLSESYPKLELALPNAVIAVNQNFALDDMLIPPNAEIAIFPPVSGGSQSAPSITEVTTQPLDLHQLVAELVQPSSGAVCLFVGVVRGKTRLEIDNLQTQVIETEKLTYEAYHNMADAKLKQVEAEMRERYPSIEGVGIIQREGEFSPGEMTVVVACSAPHRNMGIFEAARFGIERLKQIVPVWKKETRPNGSAWIEGGYHPQKGD